MATVTKYFVGAGTGVWNPPATVSVTVECWGGGQGGDNNTGNGSAGASYAKKNSFSVTTGVTVPFNLGAPGTTSAQPGGDTWFNSAATVIAPGGASGTTAIGDTTHAGGAGGLVGTGVGSPGNAGNGGAGGPTANGSAGGNGGTSTASHVGGGGGGGAANGGGAGSAGANNSATTANGGAGGGAAGGAGGTVGSPFGGVGGLASGGGGGLADESFSVASGAGAGGDDYNHGGGGAGGTPTASSDGSDGQNGGTPGGGGGCPGGSGSIIGRGGYSVIKITYTGTDQDQLFFLGVSSFTGQIPAGWTMGAKAEAWGGGGSGSNGSATLGGAGGGSGGYSAVTNMSVTAGSTLANITAGLLGSTSSISTTLVANGGGSGSLGTAGGGGTLGTGDIKIVGNNGGSGLSSSAAGGASGAGSPGATGNGAAGTNASASGAGQTGGAADAGEIAGGAGGINNGTSVTGPGSAGTSDARAGAGGGGGGHSTTAANAAGGSAGWPGGAGAGGGAGSISTAGIGAAGLVLLSKISSVQNAQSAVIALLQTTNALKTIRTARAQVAVTELLITVNRLRERIILLLQDKIVSNTRSLLHPVLLLSEQAALGHFFLSLVRSIPLLVIAVATKRLAGRSSFLTPETFVAAKSFAKNVSATMAQLQTFIANRLASKIVQFAPVNTLRIVRALRSTLPPGALLGQTLTLTTGNLLKRTITFVLAETVNLAHSATRSVNFILAPVIGAVRRIILIRNTLLNEVLTIVFFTHGGVLLVKTAVPQTINRIAAISTRVRITQAETIVVSAIKFFLRTIAVVQTQALAAIKASGRVVAAIIGQTVRTKSQNSLVRSLTTGLVLLANATVLGGRLFPVSINQVFGATLQSGRHIALINAPLFKAIAVGFHAVQAQIHQAQTFIANRVGGVVATIVTPLGVTAIKNIRRLTTLFVTLFVQPVGRAKPLGKIILSTVNTLIGIAIPKYHRKVPGVSLAPFARGTTLSVPQGLPVEKEQ